MDIGLPLLMVTTGVRRFARFPRCPSCFCLRETRRWILSWRSIWGADDFVTKPFDQQVLLAKIQGLLRRSYEFGRDESLLEYAGVILNTKSMDLHYQGKS